MKASGISLLAAILSSVCALSQVPDAEYHEAITVTRYLVDARVTDAGGNAVKGLRPEDFEVRIEGMLAEVEAATWMGEETRPTANPSATTRNIEDEETASSPPHTPGRLVIFYVNTDFGRNGPRIKGQMAFDEIFVDRIFALLRPEELVAVFSFDSHLKLRVDFTSDHSDAREAVRRSLWIEKVPLPSAPKSGPSLVRQLDAEEMKDASSGEEGLLLIANALRNIEGRKVMIMPSWGLGQLDHSTGTVSFSPEFSEAVATLRAEHVPVVSVHTGLLDGELTAGVALTARATGGVFTSAVAPLPAQSLTRIEGFFSGYYELALRLDAPLEAGEHEIEIQTKDLALRVYSPPTVVVSVSDRLYVDAVALLNAGEHDAGMAILRESISGEPVPADVLIERLETMTAAAQWEAARALIEELERLESVDGDVASMRELVTANLRMKGMSEAQAYLDDARRLQLDGVTDGVRLLLDKAIEMQPMLGDAWYERGMLRLGEGDLEGAGADLRRYLQLEPRGRSAADARAVLVVLEQ